MVVTHRFQSIAEQNGLCHAFHFFRERCQSRGSQLHLGLGKSLSPCCPKVPLTCLPHPARVNVRTLLRGRLTGALKPPSPSKAPLIRLIKVWKLPQVLTVLFLS